MFVLGVFSPHFTCCFKSEDGWALALSRTDLLLLSQPVTMHVNTLRHLFIVSNTSDTDGNMLCTLRSRGPVNKSAQLHFICPIISYINLTLYAYIHINTNVSTLLYEISISLKFFNLIIWVSVKMKLYILFYIEWVLLVSNF